MISLVRVITVGLVLIVVMASCSSNQIDSSVTCSGTSVSYKTDVSPIITSNCATNSSCHGSGSSHGPGALTTYAQIYNARAAINSSVSSGSMPRGSSLTSNQTSTIVCWINNGASNN